MTWLLPVRRLTFVRAKALTMWSPLALLPMSVKARARMTLQQLSKA
jgi:hypothetical protein